MKWGGAEQHVSATRWLFGTPAARHTCGYHSCNRVAFNQSINEVEPSTFLRVYPSMATTTNEAFVINVGGRPFTTLRSTLEQSPYFANMLSPCWTESTTYHVSGAPFVDRSPLLFEHILNFLRSTAPPVFWTRTDGFGLPLYASLLREAEYFQVDALTTWIRNEQYINAIQITSSIEVASLSDCGDGLSHFGDIEKEFEPGEVSRSSNSGKTTIFSKRLLLRRTRLRLPVSDRAFLLMRVLTNAKSSRIYSDSKALPNAKMLIRR
jgi:hypothetical protein